MNAKEYLKEMGYPDWVLKDSEYYGSIANLMEFYHQAKIGEITEEEILGMLIDIYAEEDDFLTLTTKASEAILSKLKGDVDKE